MPDGPPTEVDARRPPARPVPFVASPAVVRCEQPAVVRCEQPAG